MTRMERFCLDLGFVVIIVGIVAFVYLTIARKRNARMREDSNNKEKKEEYSGSSHAGLFNFEGGWF